MVVAIFADDCAGDGVDGVRGVEATVGVDFELTGLEAVVRAEPVLAELVAF